MPRQRYEYKTVIYQEPLLGSILLGEAKIDPERFTEFLNKNAAQGWRVRTMERENRRALLFFNREAFVCILEREVE
ncbi:MAG: DUF4177 domain-containing protein [Alphaproteobacteria bacterium]|jgi:hypothetical protein|nr:DUF4177 domain-containing protein [Alphaproteobacteria bacterium]MBP9868697.1 DUF4177 domain-containing protein [Alphaproteobacteria bacterium]